MNSPDSREFMSSEKSSPEHRSPLHPLAINKNIHEIRMKIPTNINHETVLPRKPPKSQNGNPNFRLPVKPFLLADIAIDVSPIKPADQNESMKGFSAIPRRNRNTLISSKLGFLEKRTRSAPNTPLDSDLHEQLLFLQREPRPFNTRIGMKAIDIKRPEKLQAPSYQEEKSQGSIMSKLFPVNSPSIQKKNQIPGNILDLKKLVSEIKYDQKLPILKNWRIEPKQGWSGPSESENLEVPQRRQAEPSLRTDQYEPHEGWKEHRSSRKIPLSNCKGDMLKYTFGAMMD